MKSTKMAVLALLMSASLAMVAQAPHKPTTAKPRNPRRVETYSPTASAAYGDSLKPEAVIAKALRNVTAEQIRQYDLKLVSFGTVVAAGLTNRWSAAVTDKVLSHGACVRRAQLRR